MKIIIQDTYQLYKEMLTLPEAQRETFFNEVLLEPFNPVFEIIHMPKIPQALGCLPLQGHDTEIMEMLDVLAANDSWNIARKTLEEAVEVFESEGVAIPERVILGIMIGDPQLLAPNDGYTGSGSIPGYIQIVIAPNEINLPKLKACIAHEFHHNVLFYNADWSFMEVTLGKYLAVEGFAESFAASLYGDEFVGPWVTKVQEDDLKKSRSIIGRALDTQGFMNVRKYIFGNHPMLPNEESVGIPYCGGYAVGYHAAQAFIKKSGITAAKAAVLDGDVLMRESGYFDN